MKNGSFVLDAHTGFWDASKENCKNRFGDAFIETFYAFHNSFNPAVAHLATETGVTGTTSR